MPLLTNLTISNNNVDLLMDGLFQNGLDSLSWLDLSYNKLNSIRKLQFVDMKTLVHLDLSFNSISSIDLLTFSLINNTSPIYINLEGNPIEGFNSITIQSLCGTNSKCFIYFPLICNIGNSLKTLASKSCHNRSCMVIIFNYFFNFCDR